MLLVTQCGVLCSFEPADNRLCGVAECLAVDSDRREPVRRAIAAALASLRAEAARVPPDVAAELGLPTGAEAERLVEAFAAARFGDAAL